MDISRLLVDSNFTEQASALSTDSSYSETLAPSNIRLNFTKYKYFLFEYVLGKGFLSPREKLASLYDSVNAVELAAFFHEHFAYMPTAHDTVAYVRLLGQRSAAQFADSMWRMTGVLLISSSVIEDADAFLRIGLDRRRFAECVCRVSRWRGNTAL